MRFTNIDVNFDVRYEGHQNCPKILSMNIFRVFSDHHLWHQNWRQYLWTSLCQFNFFVNLLHSPGVWIFDIWHLFDNDIFLTTWHLFDILGANCPWASLPMCPIAHTPVPIVHVPQWPCDPYPLYPIPPVPPLPICPIPLYPIPQWASLPICPIPLVPHCPVSLLPMCPIPLYPFAPVGLTGHVPHTPCTPFPRVYIAHVAHTPCDPIAHVPHGTCGLYPCTPYPRTLLPHVPHCPCGPSPLSPLGNGPCG